MTTAKDVAIAVGAGGKFLLEAYFAVMDDKEAKNPTVPATPRFTEVLLAAGAKLPSIEEALANLMHPPSAASEAPTATPAATPAAAPVAAPTPLLAAVEARISQADAVIEARMAGLQLRMQAIEAALRTLAQLLPQEPPAAGVVPTPPPSPEPTVPPNVVVLLDAREGRHHQLLTEGEEALGTIEGLVEVLTVRASVASGGGGVAVERAGHQRAEDQGVAAGGDHDSA